MTTDCAKPTSARLGESVRQESFCGYSQGHFITTAMAPKTNTAKEKKAASQDAVGSRRYQRQKRRRATLYDSVASESKSSMLRRIAV